MYSVIMCCGKIKSATSHILLNVFKLIRLSLSVGREGDTITQTYLEKSEEIVLNSLNTICIYYIHYRDRTCDEYSRSV